MRPFSHHVVVSFLTGGYTAYIYDVYAQYMVQMCIVLTVLYTVYCNTPFLGVFNKNMHWSAEIKIHNDFPNFPKNIINFWFDHLCHIIESVRRPSGRNPGENGT